MTTATESLGGYEITEGERVLIARLRLGLSQEQLAARVGVNYQTIGSVERGRHAVRPIVRRRLSEELSVTEHWLQTGEVGTRDGNGGKPIDIRRDRKANYGWSQRRIKRPYILPPPGLPEYEHRRVA